MDKNEKWFRCFEIVEEILQNQFITTLVPTIDLTENFFAENINRWLIEKKFFVRN